MVKEKASSMVKSMWSRDPAAAALRAVNELWSLGQYSIAFEYFLTQLTPLAPLFKDLIVLRKRGLWNLKIKSTSKDLNIMATVSHSPSSNT